MPLWLLIPVSVQRCDLDDGTIIVQIEDTQLGAYKSVPGAQKEVSPIQQHLSM
jgi:hypothetical protein